MSKLTGLKYLEKGLHDIKLREEDFYNYILRYSDKCNNLLWKIESLVWELDHLKGTASKFDRISWDEGIINIDYTIEPPARESDGFSAFLRKRIESLLEMLQCDADSLLEDVDNRKKQLGLKNKKILVGCKNK
jgi:hypothetical protein